ncbi:kinase-like domain-containing protein [Irpex rosettiformis]|uniref:Kinase-like domain-containing protein n=1 Tax=Irpex rosettiformis TaxID=378272 RepID=A0ACB8U1N1_9APHY|nr:kinase-like domain-containing protein [Irpex rosettiformis]
MSVWCSIFLDEELPVWHVVALPLSPDHQDAAVELGGDYNVDLIPVEQEVADVSELIVVYNTEEILTGYPGGVPDQLEVIDDAAPVDNNPEPFFDEQPSVSPIPEQPSVNARALCSRFIEHYDIHPKLIAKYDLQNGQELGASGNGFVLSAQRISDGQDIADVIVMDGLKHDGIVQLLDVFRDEHYVYIVGTRTSWGGVVSTTTCRTYLYKREPLSRWIPDGVWMNDTKDAKYVFSQLVDAVRYLHTKGIAYCDIKPANILIDEQLKIKLIDFGNTIVEEKDWN